MELSDYLKRLNLTDKEIKTYLVSLQIGESTIMPLVKKLSLPRTTVFHTLERLDEKKLIEIVQKGTRRIYVPYPPRHIITLLKQERKEIEGKIDSLERSLPELSRLYSLSPFQPKVRFFKDKEIKDMYSEIVELPIDEVWYVIETKKLIEAIGQDCLKRTIKKRIEKGIRSKSIRIRESESEEELFSPKKEYLRSVRYAPADFHCPTHVLIYGDNVGLITTGEENFGLVITSREYAETMRSWFSQLWKVSTER